jgi:outer membrane protein assembly factor BamB
VAVTGLALVMLLAGCERELILPGERFPVRAPLDASLPVEGQPAPTAPPLMPENRSEPVSLPAPQANAEWTHRGGNARNAQVHGQLSAQPQRVWSVTVGQGNSRRNRIATAPVVAGGAVFTMDSDALVQATSVQGAVLWRADLVAPFDRGGNVSGGGLSTDGTRVYAATGYGELVALDARSGAVIWRQRLDSPVTGAPTVDGNAVYVVGRDGSGWAVAADTGRVLWTLPNVASATGVLGSAGPAVTDRAVLFPFASGGLTAALKVSGTRVWDAPVTGQRVGRAYAGLTDITGDPVVVDGVLYAGTAAGRTVAMRAASGERIWTVTEGAMNPPLVTGGSVFVVNDEARLVRLDAATGEVIWAIEMPYWDKDRAKRRKAITAHFGPVLAGGRLLVAGGDGQLRVFDPADGSMLGGLEIPGGAASAPALAGGMVFVLGANGQLHAFR